MDISVKNISPYKNIIASLIIVIVFVIIIRSIVSHYSFQENKIAERIQELEKGDSTIKKWEKLKSERNELDSIFLGEDSLFFKKFIEEKANASKINITLLKTFNTEKDLYWETKMELNIACTYRDFIAFTEAIEKKSVIIERVVMSMGGRGKNIDVSLTLKGVILKR